MANKAVYESKEGWTVLYYQQNINTTTKAVIGFKCGAKKDGKQKGIAHLLEHMLFNSNSTYDKQKVYDYFKYTDTRHNAYTSDDVIAIDFDCTNSNVDQVFKIMSQILLKKEFTQEELDRERQVVIHELHQRVAEDPAYKKLIGTEATLNKITPQDLTDFAKKYFVKENLVMSVVSSLDYEQILELLYKNFVSKTPSNPKNKVIIKQRPSSLFNKLSFYENIPGEKNFVVEYVFKGNQNKELDEVYNRFESFMFNDLLMQKFREKNPLTYTPEFFSTQDQDTKIKVFRIVTSPNKAIETINTLNTFLDDLITNGISNKQMFEFKTNLLAERERKANIKTRKPNRMFTDYIYGEPVFISDFFKKVASLTREDINNYIKETYGASKICLEFVGDMLEASNLLKASDELLALEEKIRHIPYTVPDEVCEKMYTEEMEKILSQPIYLPTVNEILKSFRLDKKMISSVSNKLTLCIDEETMHRILEAKDKWKNYKFKYKLTKEDLDRLHASKINKSSDNEKTK